MSTLGRPFHHFDLFFTLTTELTTALTTGHLRRCLTNTSRWTTLGVQFCLLDHLLVYEK